MSGLSSIYGGMSPYQKPNIGKNDLKGDNKKKTKASENTEKTQKTESKATSASNAKVYTGGKVIGQPKLSEKASDYYESLKKKYGNMDFILVSEDKKETAKAQIASLSNPDKMVVLIDEDKVEQMASDEAYRDKYESIISNAANSVSDLKSQLEASGASVQAFGMQIDDKGQASYFAVLEKSSAAQKERIEKKLEEKKAEKKEEAKEAKEKKIEKKAEEKAEEKKKAKLDEKEKIKARAAGETDDGKNISSFKKEYKTISAASIDELLSKVVNYSFNDKSQSILSEAEKQVGQNFDFRG